MKISKLLKTSILKTIYFNIHYFGIKSLFKPYALIARGVQFKCLKGKIELENKKIGIVRIGYPSLGTKNDSTTKGTINISGKLLLRENVSIARGASIDCGENGILEIGSLMMTGDTKIICKKNIKIGNNCMISLGGYIMDTDFHDIYKSGNIINYDKPISIGDHCWIGMNCTILKGSSLPNNSIIAAGSTVTKKLEKENCIYFNNEIIKEDVEWK